MLGLTGVVLGGLAGCADASPAEPDARVSRVPTAEPTPTPGPPVEEPAKPAAWSDNGADGAAAAAVWFLSDEYRFVLETNDTTEWQRLSHPECQFCADTVADAQAMVDTGWVSRQDEPNRVVVTRVEELNPLAYSVLVELRESVVRDFNSNGQPVRASGGDEGQVLVNLHREGPDWQLRAGQWFAEDVAVPSALAGQG